MDLTLLVAAALLGLAGTPHCAAMCSAACAAVGGGVRGWPMAGFQFARAIGYALAGALAAGSVQALGRLGQWTPLLKPLWIAVHAAALLLGLWLLLRGAQPQWMRQLVLVKSAPPSGGTPMRWRDDARRSARAGLAGLLWVAWPCALLQSALVVAALASSAPGGAAVMAVFAGASSLGLLAAPALVALLGSHAGANVQRGATRAAGALLVGASAWALGHGLWHRLAAWCAS